MKRHSAVALVGALVALSAQSKAAELFTFDGALSGDPVVSLSWTANGQTNTENAYAGLYQVTLGSGSSAMTQNVFCVDPTNNISAGNSDQATLQNFTGPSGFSTASYNNAGNAGANANGHTTQQNANAIAYLVSNYLNNVSLTPTQAANVNVAIWAISYDGGQDPGNANSTLTASGGGISDSAIESYISAAYANSSGLSNVVWIDNKPSSNYQDFALNGSISSQGIFNTPEPGMAQMAGVMGLTLGGGLLRRRKRSAS